MKSILIFCIAAFVGIQISFAQTIITGKVTSKTDGKAVSGAVVRAKAAADITVMTDVDGNYSINVPSGVEVLELNAVGFITQTEGIGQKKVINFVITPTNTKSKNLVKSKPIKMEAPIAEPEKNEE